MPAKKKKPVIKIAGKELKPFLMTWGQRKDLRRALAQVAGSKEQAVSLISKEETPEAMGQALGEMVLTSEDMQEALLVWAYDLKAEDIQGCKPGDVSRAVLEFMEANADPDGDEDSKKAAALLTAAYK